MIFTDLGVVTTTAKTGPALTRALLTEMSQGEPDVIVFELGDGILGAYGVEAILSSPDIQQALTCVVLSANDPVAAWGGVKLLREKFGIEPAVVTGPATDNAVGVNIIRDQFGVPRSTPSPTARSSATASSTSLGLKAKQPRSRRSETRERRHPVIVLGGTGYVAGELLRLIAAHPQLELAACCRTASPASRSRSRSRTSRRSIRS